MFMPERLGGRYELRGLLGRGGMGEVHDGWDTRLGRPVAIKLLRPEFATRDDIRRRFDAEARVAASLNHPHVVAVHDSGEDAGVPYIVMERLPGYTLADDLTRGAMSQDRVRTVLIEVLEAVAAAHDVGILHRDLKPGNILFSVTGGAKVTDFGIAKSADTDHTLTGQILGTAAYLTPQRLAGAPATVSDDLYAVGVIGYEALSGHRPFAHGDLPALVRAICDELPPPLAAERPDLDPALVAAIDRAMTRDPEQRFTGARDMLDAVRRRGQGTITAAARTRTEVLTTGVSTTAPVARGAGHRVDGLASVRRRGLLAAALAVVALVSVGLVVASRGPGSGAPPAAAVPAPAPTVASATSPPALTTTAARTAPGTAVILPVPTTAPASGQSDKPGKSKGTDKGNGKGNGGH